MIEVSFRKIDYFPKVPAHTDLTILDSDEKEKGNTESHKTDELCGFSNDSSRD